MGEVVDMAASTPTNDVYVRLSVEREETDRRRRMEELEEALRVVEGWRVIRIEGGRV